MILSTLNRTLKSFALAIVGAEYILRWLPVGTHQWQRFVTACGARLGAIRRGPCPDRHRGPDLRSLLRRMAPGNRHRCELFCYRDAGGSVARTGNDLSPALRPSASSTYSYLIASRQGAEALIIDPVLEKVDRYIQLMNELDLRLVKAVDTHLHADHVTGLGALRDRTRCITVMGEHTKADVVSMRVADGDKPRHRGRQPSTSSTRPATPTIPTSFLRDRVFTGDTLLIRGTGRTDFQNGDPRAQYDRSSNAC